MTDRPDRPANDERERELRRERLFERMDPGPVTIDREPVGGPIPQLTDEELREAGLDR
ncbi:hypothetical protein FB565_001657 [Actinoplanes lutulentus]|uniref:Uncharacterized protein n=1 Tax=Actinoplanes lutulentus TaxID=1287878 RepID=A0A327ZF07_9ACTN|nr:hypothetical protein [Actinoplanes lutulentus]MBB2941953.1 hypothetical protein [Actinoplanes lutulentus]RAK39865.1 hypothetical protein B0I29_104404 [Actinoplanes lutulentus]